MVNGRDGRRSRPRGLRLLCLWEVLGRSSERRTGTIGRSMHCPAADCSIASDRRRGRDGESYDKEDRERVWARIDEYASSEADGDAELGHISSEALRIVAEY
jgi:hypothetical protein